MTLTDHPGWASQPAAPSPVARRYLQACEQNRVAPAADPALAVADAVDVNAALVRSALESLGDDTALAALEAVLDLSLLERQLVEDGARRRALALLQVQEGLSKLRAVDDVATAVAGLTADICKASPQGLSASKALTTAPILASFDTSAEYLTGQSAQLFVSPEAHEGMLAFLQKRPPDWV